jgi:GntR family transcriptional regulator
MFIIKATMLGVMSAVKPPEYDDTNLALGAVDRADPTYLHEQVAVEIRRAIADGEAGPGERIPQAKDLAAVLGVNTNTVLRALRMLRDEGLLEMGRGRAIVVAGTPDRGAIVTKMKELLELGRRSGYRRDELVEMFQALPG